jgi:AraC-like DNA-binding protein
MSVEDLNIEQLPDTLFTVIEKGNNRNRFISFWNDKVLFIWIEVSDRLLVAEFDTSITDKIFRSSKTGYKHLWMGDCVELCFDPKNTRPVLRTREQLEMLYSILNIFQGNNIDFYEEKVHLWGKNVKTEIDVKGTINDNTDEDTGFVIRTWIPWKSLGVAPKRSHEMGFDLFNMDFDEPGITGVRYTLSGINRQNNDNPSEWATLVLYRRQTPALFWILGLLILGTVVVLIISIRLKKAKPPDLSEPVRSEAVKKAIEFMAAHYQDDVKIEDIAQAASLSPAWFSTTFKKEVGKAVSQYLTDIRLEKACDLLKTTKKSVTEITYEVGFKDQSHFTKVFKKSRKMTPVDYRKSE